MTENNKEKELEAVENRIEVITGLKKTLAAPELDELGLEHLATLRDEVSKKQKELKSLHKQLDEEATRLNCYSEGNFDETRCKDEDCDDYPKCLEDSKKKEPQEKAPEQEKVN